jgi:hypothetical protein
MGTGAHRNAVPQATSSVNSVWSIGLHRRNLSPHGGAAIDYWRPELTFRLV